MADEMFKTTLMGGFDKDDVLNQVRQIKDEAYAEKSKLIKLGKEKDKRISDLQSQLQMKDIQREQEIEEIREMHKNELLEMNQRLAMKEAQKDKLEREISEKYQKYIDRYELIGNLILEAQEKADKIVADAEKQRDAFMEEAHLEAQRCLDAVQSEVNDKLAEGKRKYIAVQEEMNEIVQLINQAQRRFMSSYKEVHKIISTMPESMRELEEDAEEERLAADQAESEILENMQEHHESEGQEMESAKAEEESLDEGDEEEIFEEEILRILEEEDTEEE
ncbi:MAG: hypothetical protein KH828_09890 [Clostridiales bacterium]|nr:hypothetical protein [Clostridiales bacterium]